MSEHEHYFTAQPASAGEQRSLTVRLAGREVTVRTAPGIFSPDGLDKGTAVLLREVPEPPGSGNLLDLGCGWGPIAITLGLLSPLRASGPWTSTSAPRPGDHQRPLARPGRRQSDAP